MFLPVDLTLFCSCEDSSKDDFFLFKERSPMAVSFGQGPFTDGRTAPLARCLFPFRGFAMGGYRYPGKIYTSGGEVRSNVASQALQGGRR